MKKFLMGFLAVLLAGGFFTQATAAPATGNAVPIKERVAKIKADQAARKAAMEAERAPMKALFAQLRAELKKKPVNKNKVNDLNKQIDIQRETVQVKQMQSMMDNNPNLKPEQKKRYGERIQKAKDRLAKKKMAK
jgi:Spy/CpxP family protein refolding chaperone